MTALGRRRNRCSCSGGVDQLAVATVALSTQPDTRLGRPGLVLMLCTGNRAGLRPLQGVAEGSDRVQMPERSPVPSGLVDQPGLITRAEEQPALAVLEAMESNTIARHGRTARRTVGHFGLDDGAGSWKLVPTDPCLRIWPGCRSGPRAWRGWTRAASPRSSSPDPHRGAPSAGTATRPVRRHGGRDLPGVHLPHALPARPGTGTPGGRGHPRPLLRLGPVRAARDAWQHSIPPPKALGYSITFRTSRRPSFRPASQGWGVGRLR